MIHHCRVDASRQVVRNHFENLDIDLLTLDETDVSEEERPELYAQSAHIRSALVARVADIGMTKRCQLIL